MTSEKTKTEYIDLITSGLGYLNRSRTVQPDEGPDYESVNIAAKRGKADKPRYTYYDCRVVGADAIAFVKQYRDAINDRNSTVQVHFNIGDEEPDSYVVQKGDHAGKRRHFNRGRLLKIKWAKIGDTVVLKAQKDEATANQDVNTSTDDAKSWEDTLGDTVKLDKNDPELMNKISLLMKRGYHWDEVNDHWVLKAA